ncbi:hypothetical protein AAFF_G00031890 [Aldrovandia affinis]|uniref:Uncharacterized protein n=1 Tax=Aldrovandia affinis TaxID=143900 RepID=A0AAD7S3S9_9TELE|nr:hypothetical protein AAFF_G00031890 [Aldrovandia affinis]
MSSITPWLASVFGARLVGAITGRKRSLQGCLGRGQARTSQAVGLWLYVRQGHRLLPLKPVRNVNDRGKGRCRVLNPLVLVSGRQAVLWFLSVLPWRWAALGRSRDQQAGPGFELAPLKEAPTRLQSTACPDKQSPSDGRVPGLLRQNWHRAGGPWTPQQWRVQERCRPHEAPHSHARISQPRAPVPRFRARQAVPVTPSDSGCDVNLAALLILQVKETPAPRAELYSVQNPIVPEVSARFPSDGRGVLETGCSAADKRRAQTASLKTIMRRLVRSRQPPLCVRNTDRGKLLKDWGRPAASGQTGHLTTHRTLASTVALLSSSDIFPNKPLSQNIQLKLMECENVSCWRMTTSAEKAVGIDRRALGTGLIHSVRKSSRPPLAPSLPRLIQAHLPICPPGVGTLEQD